MGCVQNWEVELGAYLYCRGLVWEAGMVRDVGGGVGGCG
jgi:hypothetical protein